MNAASVSVTRTNPFDTVLRERPLEWTECEDMPTPQRFDGADLARGRLLGLIDQSWRRRAGCKGPACASLLAECGLPMPDLPNSFVETAEGGLVCRLGRSEFLVENGSGESLLARLGSLEGLSGVYPVLRQDGSLLLTGSRIEDLLLQTCSLDFARLAATPGQLVLTTMVGVGVTALWLRAAGPLEGPALRLWFDGTYGDYMWSTLAEIAGELGGGPVGLAATR